MAKRRTKGSGTVYKRNNGYYVYKYLDANGTQRYKSLRTKNRAEAELQAEKFVTAIKAKDEDEVLLQSAKAKRIITETELPLADVWDAFLKTKPTAGAGTLKLYQRALNEFINWLADKRPSINSFTQLDKQTVISYTEHIWESGISASTYNDKRNAIGHITQKLENRYDIQANHWIIKDLRKKSVQQKRLPLNITQTESLLKIINDPASNLPYQKEMSCLIQLCLYAGMRLVDAVHLKKENIEDGYITYEPQKTRRTNGAEAEVFILPILYNALSNLDDNDSEYVLPQIQKHYAKNADYIKKNALAIITKVTGDQRNDMTVQASVNRRKYGVHSLRHSFAMQCRQLGANSVELKDMIGDLITTIEKFYFTKKINKRKGLLPGFSPLLINDPQKQLDDPQKQLPDDPGRSELIKLIQELDNKKIKNILTFAREV